MRYPATLALLTLISAVSTAQQVPIRQVGPAEATSKETVGFLYGVRELSDGRLLANDAGGRRLLLFDASLTSVTVVADSGSATRSAYGKRPTGIIPYLGDSTLLIDLSSRAFLVVDPGGKVPRVMSPPRPGDVGYLWNPAIGTPGFDAAGRLIYRTFLMPAIKAPEAGKPFIAPEMPDSAPLLRTDFEKRTADTLDWIRVPKMKVSTTALAGGGVTMRAMINPMGFLDDWTMLPDGSIAILRGRDYHIDWINADGTRSSSPRMPFDWKRLSDDEKAAIIDSTKAQLQRQMAAASADGRPVPMEVAVASHSMTFAPVARADGSGAPAPKSASTVGMTPAATQVPEVVPPSDLPDYVPPVLHSGSMKADPQGNVWILPSTSSRAGDGVGLLYDVVNRKGEVFQRVRLPAGRALEGFGANGVVYLTSHDSSGTRLERSRLR